MRTPRVAIFGAGLSGICLAIHLKKAGIETFTIFEKSDGVGGTWRDNAYPGAACDVPSMFYSFSFEVKTDWSRRFAPQPEILDYVEHCTDKYGVRPHVRFHAEVASARYDQAAGVWRVRTVGGEEHEFDVVVSGVGQLNRPFVPDIPGLETFGGARFHSARWDRGHDVTGETVAVVGNGASAVQIVPEVAPRAKRLYVFQRSANWMIARKDQPYSPRAQAMLARVPGLARATRALVWALLEARWPAFAGNSPRVTEKLTRLATAEMEQHVGDPALRRALTPDYPVGCKRILISDDYYQTLVRENVEVVTSPIREVTADAIVTEDGTSRPVDTIVLATGFRTTEFLQPMEVTGVGGRSLNDVWRAGAEAYYGLALPGFPSFFMLYGPNTNLGHNSIILMIECQVGYVMRCLERMRARGLSALEVRDDAMRRWDAECQSTLSRTVWAQGCESWYKNAGGRITNNWPYSTMTYWWRTRRPNFADWVEIQRPAVA